MFYDGSFEREDKGNFVLLNLQQSEAMETRLTLLLRCAARSSRIDYALLCARGYSLALVVCEMGAIMQPVTLRCSYKQTIR
jgi:hypothetical protein